MRRPATGTYTPAAVGAMGGTGIRETPYARAMGSLHFTEAARMRMAGRLHEAASGGRFPAMQDRAGGANPQADGLGTRHLHTTGVHGHALTRRAAVVAAAALAGGTGIAWATGSLDGVADALGRLFGTGDEQRSLLGTYAGTPHVSATSDGLTISADAVVGDEHCLTLVLSLSREDGTPLGLADVPRSGGHLDLDFDAAVVDVPGLDARGPQSWFFDTADGGESVQFVYRRGDVYSDASSLAEGAVAHVSLAGLGYASPEDDGTTSRVSVSDGSWELDVPLDWQDATRHLEAGQTLVAGGGTDVLEALGLSSDATYQATIETLDVSPVGVYLVIEADALADEGAGASATAGAALLNLPVSVRLADGSDVRATYLSGAIEDDRLRLYLALDRIVDADAIASVSVAGTQVSADGAPESGV